METCCHQCNRWHEKKRERIKIADIAFTRMFPRVVSVDLLALIVKIKSDPFSPSRWRLTSIVLQMLVLVVLLSLHSQFSLFQGC